MRREKKSIKEMRGERKVKKNSKRKMPFLFVPCQNATISQQYCSMLQKFDTSNKPLFLIFDLSNISYYSI